MTPLTNYVLFPEFVEIKIIDFIMSVSANCCEVIN